MSVEQPFGRDEAFTGGMPEKHDVFGEYDRYNTERKEKLNWTGTFGEYVDMVTENPEVARSAYQIAHAAVSRPDFFTTGRNALFGAEKATERFVDILNAGAQGLEVGKRIIMLIGPPGSGKSTLVNGTKRGIEEYTRTDEGAMYAIADCPMQEEPLHLLPKEIRDSFEDRFGVHVEGSLCPHCQNKYGGNEVDAEKLRNVPIKRLTISENDRVGIGTFKPSDPKSQDITELVGSVDFSGLGEFGTASDARAYKFDGELNVANRGVMEFVEMLKSDEKFLYTLLDLAQDKVIKAPRFPNIYADEVIIAHTNMTEFNSYVNNPKNEAIKDRMTTIEVPYALKVSDEHKIHEKLIGQSELVRKKNVHINPQSLNVAATFAVLSRMKPSKKYTEIQKLKIYDGQETDGLTQRDLKELQEEASIAKEGMSGISPRYVIDSLSTALIEEGKACLTPIDTLRALRDNLKYHPHTSDMKQEDKDALNNALTITKEEYDNFAKKEVQSAFVYSFNDTARSLSDNYLDNVMAFCSRDKIIDPITGEESEPDERLMRSIEEQINVSDNSKAEFRSELLTRMASVMRKGETFDYKSHPRLNEAVEKKIFTDLKDVVKLTISPNAPKNEEQQGRIHDVIRNLTEEKGYCPHCADEMVRYVGNLMNKSE